MRTTSKDIKVGDYLVWIKPSINVEFCHFIQGKQYKVTRYCCENCFFNVEDESGKINNQLADTFAFPETPNIAIKQLPEEQ